MDLSLLEEQSDGGAETNATVGPQPISYLPWSYKGQVELELDMDHTEAQKQTSLDSLEPRDKEDKK